MVEYPAQTLLPEGVTTQLLETWPSRIVPEVESCLDLQICEWISSGLASGWAGDSTEEQCLASGLPMGLAEAVFEVYILKLGSSLPNTSLTSFTTEGQGLAEVGEGHREAAFASGALLRSDI